MNLVFDFDGTICDGTDAVVEILNLIFTELKIPPLSKSELRRSGIAGIFTARHITQTDLKPASISGREEFGRRLPSMSTFYGLPETLTRLSKKHTLGIITSNYAEYVREFLSKNRMSGLFAFIEDERNIFGKHDKIREKSADYYIGDETRDIEAARKAGAKAVAVTWGFESKASLEKSRPDLLITSPRQLLDHFLKA